VNLSNAANGTIIDSQGQGTINDNDPAPSLSIKDVSVAEGDTGTTPLVFTVTLSAVSGQTVTVNYATTDNTATAGIDYESASGTLTFNAGETSKTMSVLVNGDTTFEQNEVFFVNLTTPTNAGITDAQGQGTIINDDAAPPTPTFSINDVNITEGNNGAASATFNITLTPSSNQTVTVDFVTANGTATTAGNDYQPANGTLTFNPGDTAKPISVTVNGDLLVEPDETFVVNLTNPTGGALIGDNQGLGTINNDDLAMLVISQIYGGGGNSGATFKNDFIEIFNRGTTTVNLNGYSVQYAGDTAASWSRTNLTNALIEPGQYYLIQEAQGANGTSDLPTPDAAGSIAIATSAGKVALVSNTTLLTGACPANASILDLVGYGSSASCSEGSARAAAPANNAADLRKGGGCVDNNDNAGDFFVHTPSPRNGSTVANTCTGQTTDIAISDVTVTEGDTGTVSANFTISLVAASAAIVTVDYATANGTAIEPSDYKAIPATQLVFNPGETSKLITVLVNGDTLDEPDETFLVNLSNATNASILDNQGQGTINDNDVPPTLTINDVSLNEGNTGSTTFHFIVSLSAPALTGGVTFDIATQDGTATTAGSDYSAKSQTSQTIAAGSTTFAFDVTVNGDTDIETSETFFVNVSNAAGATVGDGQGQGTIQNDDSPALSMNDVTVTEGNSGTTPATFIVTLSPSSNQTVTVDYGTSSASPATAAAGIDYVSTNGTLTFNPGETSRPITVSVNGDTTNEAVCETFFVNLSNPTNATISGSQGQGGITDDDGTKLVISQAYGGGGNAGAQYTNDFIEIFNRGSSAINLNGMSVQYSSATSTSGNYQVTPLTNVTLQPGQYYLVQEDATNTASCGNAPCGIALPLPNATGTIGMAAAAGKVVLVNGITALSAAGCPSGATILDFLGYGTSASTGANCREGGATTAANAPTLSNTTAALRKLSACQDLNVNANDFQAFAPNPRNTATALSPCTCSTSYLSLFVLGGESWRASLSRLSQ
ncbi:MAG: large repetitive protein, partial [Blastocatellia bacterium]|nr:large repetitive protein [Blastocatellia bacterium]